VPPELIVSLCLQSFPGANQALIHLSRTTGLTRHISLAGTRPDGPEVHFLSGYLREQPPSLVLFGGWSPVYAALLSALRDAPISVGVYWTSSGGQSDMSEEIPKLAQILDEPAIDHYLFCSEGLAEGLRASGRSAWYLPLTVMLPNSSRPASVTRHTTAGLLNISLFCPAPEYRRKNILNCLLALSMVRGRYRLFLNGLSHHPAYLTLLKTLRITYRDLGWMERAPYEETLWSIDLGLQLSFAESFNYVAAEHLLRGVPVLASRMVPVMALLSPEIQEQLIVDTVDNAGAIRERIQSFLDTPARCAALGARARQELIAANERNVARAVNVLHAIVGGGG